MKQSASHSEYITPPPEFPPYIIKRHVVSVVRQLMNWAKKEHSDRIVYCAQHGYMKEFKRLNEDYSPIRVLAELHGFRKLCAYFDYNNWNAMTRQERRFVTGAYELRDLLFSGK